MLVEIKNLYDGYVEMGQEVLESLIPPLLYEEQAIGVLRYLSAHPEMQ